MPGGIGFPSGYVLPAAEQSPRAGRRRRLGRGVLPDPEVPWRRSRPTAYADSIDWPIPARENGNGDPHTIAAPAATTVVPTSFAG